VTGVENTDIVQNNPFAAVDTVFSMEYIWWGFLAFVVGHGFSLFYNFIKKEEYKKEIKEIMMAPYKRIMVMQFTIILGGFILMIFKAPVALLLLFIVLKTFVDYRAHIKEHLE